MPRRHHQFPLLTSGVADGDKFTVKTAAGSRSIRADVLKAAMQPGPLTRFRAAAANANTTPVHWLAIGDSVTEGVSASEFGKDYGTKLLRLLQAHYQTGTGGAGFINPFTYIPTYDDAPTLGNPPITWSNGVNYWDKSGGGAVSDINTNQDHAFGGRTYNCAANETMTLHFTGTSFLLQYTLGSSAFTVTYDGDAPVTVTPGAGSTWTGTYQSVTKTSGTHTVVVNRVTAGQTIQVRGAFVFDGDEGHGIRYWNHARSGANTNNAPGYASASLTDQLTAGLVTSAPSLVTILLGFNDMGNTHFSTWKTQLQTVIATVKAACTNSPPFLLIGPYEPNYGQITPLPNFGQYRQAAADVATEDPSNVAYVDLSLTLAKPTAANSWDGGKMETGSALDISIHPYDAGFVAIADALYATLVG